MTAAPEILYRQAAALLEQSNTTQALPLLQQAAEQGYTEAAFVLGDHLLQNGHPEQALPWLEAAAAQRHPQGTLYPAATTRTQRYPDWTSS